MKTSVLALVALIALTGCKSARVIGDTVYHRLSWPSGFGSYQHIIVVYPLGKTNLQQVINSESVPGPIPSMFGAAVKSAAIVWGAHEMRNIGRSKENSTVNVSNTGSSQAGGGSTTAYGGSGGSVGDVSGGGAPVTVNQTVNAPGSNHQPGGFPHRAGKGW